MAENIRISEDTDYRVTVLSNQLNLSKGGVVEMLVDSFYGNVSKELYRSLGRAEIKAKPLKNKRVRRVCIQK